MRSPTSRIDSHTVLSHSIVVAPQMSFTRTCEGTLLGVDALDERRHLLGHEVVDLDRDARPPAASTSAGRLLDRLGPVHLRALRPGGAAGDVNGGAGGTELDGDPSSGAARAPATRATLPCSGPCIDGSCLTRDRGDAI